MLRSPSVKRHRPLFPQDTGKTTCQTAGEGRLRDETDTCRLEGTKGDICEELCDGGSTKVDRLSVLSGFVDAKVVDRLFLAELVPRSSSIICISEEVGDIPSEFESSLDGVTNDGRTETSE